MRVKKGDRKKRVILKASKNLKRVKSKMIKFGITEKDVDEAVRWARKKFL